MKRRSSRHHVISPTAAGRAAARGADLSREPPLEASPDTAPGDGPDASLVRPVSKATAPRPGLNRKGLEPGLHLIATPIGSARDITLRALDALAFADLLVAEDTRMLRHLMAIHAIPLNGRRIIAYNDHSWPAAAPAVMRALDEGQSVALCSDAGTPGIADPGYEAVRAAIDAGHRVHSLPGPSAAVTALTLSGLPTDRFLFAGFPPPRETARRRFLAEVTSVPATVILFESPRRVNETLRELSDIAGAERRAAVCRELTKRFEEVHRGSIAELALAAADWTLKGEFVIVVGRPLPAVASAEEIGAALRLALSQSSLRDAVDQVAARFSAPRRDVYEQALTLRGEG